MATFTFLCARHAPPGFAYPNPITIKIRKSDGTDWIFNGYPTDVTEDVTDSRLLEVMRADTIQWEEVV